MKKLKSNTDIYYTTKRDAGLEEGGLECVAAFVGSMYYCFKPEFCKESQHPAQ